MNTEERLAQINEVSQRILNMPEAERQAYIEQYWDAINEMLNEYKELRRPKQSMAKDPITERTPEQQAALSWDQPTQETPRQRRRRQDRRQDTPETETPTEENVWPVIVRINTDWTVSDANGNNYIVDKDWNIVGSAAGTWSQADTAGTWSNVVTPKGSPDNSWADAPMWPLYWLWGLAALWTYWAIKWINAKNKPKVIPPGTDIKALWQQWVKWNVPEPKTPAPKTPALWEVREWKLVSEWLLSDGKVIQQWPKWYLPNNSEAIKTDIKKFMLTPEWKSLVEWYYTPVKTAVENATEKWVKNAVKKWAKNVTLNAIEKWAKKALPRFIQKAIF